MLFVPASPQMGTEALYKSMLRFSIVNYGAVFSTNYYLLGTYYFV